MGNVSRTQHLASMVARQIALNSAERSLELSISLLWSLDRSR
ncbi:hypothetical protein [Leptospira noguchii]|nr:hypothetical protein [Leptospira noguchii]